jgi:hypothetical protein
MKRVLAIGLVSLAAGCGSSKSSPPLFGGFTPATGAAAILAPATCTNIPFLGATGISGILIELTSRGDACNVLTQAKQCGLGKSSTTLLGAALSGVVGGVASPAGPGTYPWLVNPPTGAFLTSIASAAQVDALCSGVATDMTGGSITISSVTGTPPTAVAGSMNVAFDNGQAFSQAFDVAVCPVTIDVCSLFDPCFTPVCVP